MLGYSPEDLSGKGCIVCSLAHPDEQKEVKKLWKRFIGGTKDAFHHEFRIRHKNGSHIHVSIHLSAVAGSTKALGVIVGRSSRENLNNALIELGTRYKSLFHNEVFGIIRAEANSGKIAEFNRKAFDLIGPEGLGSFDQLAGLLFQQEKETLVREFYEKGLIASRDVALKGKGHKDQPERWAIVSMEMSGDRRHILIYITDIHEIKNSLLETTKINHDLENFVYHASHDLRSPLKSIVGLVSILKMENDPSARLNCIEMIEGSIIRLERLVNDLLTLSRTSAIDDPLSTVNLMIELSNSVANLYHTADARNLEVIPIIYQPYPLVTDVTRIRIILNNLLSNAFKYRSFEKDASFVRIEARVQREKATIIIEDNGIGIPEEKRDKVFDMFYRASESGEGSGLGLYIVKKAVEKMKGSISLDSEVTVGSKFTIEVPNHWDGVWR